MKKRNLRQAINRAIRDCDCSRRDKFKLRMAMAFNPNVREMVEEDAIEHLKEVGAINGFLTMGVLTEFDPEKWERIFQLLIEYLPQIIAIFVNLFSGDGNNFKQRMQLLNEKLSDCGDDCEDDSHNHESPKPTKVQNRKTVKRKR